MVDMFKHTGIASSERRTDLRLAFKPSRYPALSALMDDPKYSKNILLAAAEIGAIYLLATDEERTQMLSGLSARIKADFDESVERVANSNWITDDERGLSKSPHRQGTSVFPRDRQPPPAQPEMTAMQDVPIFNRSGPADGQPNNQTIPRGIPLDDRSTTKASPSQNSDAQPGASSPGISRILNMYSSTFTADGQGSE